MTDEGSEREELVATLVGHSVVVQDDGRPRLPRRGEDPSWAASFMAATGDARALPVAPAMLVGDIVLNVFSARTDARPGDRPLLDLDDLDLLAEDAAIAASIRAAVEGLVDPPPLRPGWYSTSFLEEAEDWVDGHLARLGRLRTGPLEPVTHWSLSAVLRVPHDGGAAYLKACSPHFHAEPAITELLAARLGDVVPEVLGTDHRRGWLLMAALPEGTPDPVRAATVLAEVQERMAGHSAQLAAAGAPDRGAAATLSAFEAVVEDGIELPHLSPEERDGVRALLPWVTDVLGRLDACGLPTTLVHGDLHLGNVASDEEHLVVYDWSDACLGMPAVDLPVLLGQQEESVKPLVSAAYAAVWREHVPSADLDLALSLAAVACDVFQAVSYDAIARDLEPGSRWELEGAATQRLRRLLATRAESVGLPH